MADSALGQRTEDFRRIVAFDGVQNVARERRHDPTRPCRNQMRPEADDGIDGGASVKQRLGTAVGLAHTDLPTTPGQGEPR